MGYYSARKDKLLKDFDSTSVLIKPSLVSRYGEELTSTLQKDARQEYEKLIPKIPYIKGPRARLLNSFLLITAQELAAYKAMKNHSKSPGGMGTVPQGYSLQNGGNSAMEALAFEAFHVFLACKEDRGEASPAIARGSFR